MRVDELEELGDEILHNLEGNIILGRNAFREGGYFFKCVIYCLF